MTNTKSGLFAAATAYIIWGISPIYYAELKALSALEILGHRVLWSVVLLLPMSLHHIGPKKLILFLFTPHQIYAILASTCLLALNWLTFIYGINSGNTIEVSLGYFLNPIFTVLLGRFIFKESLSLNKKISLFLAFIGLAYQVYSTGRLSWISFALAFSFGLYGLIKKTQRIPARIGFTLETLILLPFAAIYLFYLHSQNNLVFTKVSISTQSLIFLAGPLTLSPLILFSYGAQRLQLSTIGFLQYLAPSLQLLVALSYFNEPLGRERLFSFTIIWLGLLILILPPIKIPINNSNPQG